MEDIFVEDGTGSHRPCAAHMLGEVVGPTYLSPRTAVKGGFFNDQKWERSKLNVENSKRIVITDRT